jgi:transcriptional regulator with XRE-family HTH domain
LGAAASQVKDFVVVYSEQDGVTMMATALGEKLRKLRKDKKLTLDQLAALSGASKSYVWELENKNPPRPSAEKVSRLAQALGVTTDFLLDENLATPGEAEKDAHFYRKYQKAPPDTKERLRLILEALDTPKE